MANLRFNPVVNTKLPAILSYRRSTTVSLETYPFIHLSKNQLVLAGKCTGLLQTGGQALANAILLKYRVIKNKIQHKMIDLFLIPDRS